MNVLSNPLLACICLLGAAQAFAGGATARPGHQNRRPLVAAAPSPDRSAQPCMTSEKHQRNVWPPAASLWGTLRTWNTRHRPDERSSVLTSVALDRAAYFKTGPQALTLENARLIPVPATSRGVPGTVLRGSDSNNKPVDVVICRADPDVTGDSEVIWYQIKALNAATGEWENPCVGTGQEPNPPATALRGYWDEAGRHHDDPNRFTFACRHGALARCIDWGYRPWAKKNGRSLAPFHQACTRMARADYCGDGRSHIRQETPIDMYDGLGINVRTREASRNWDPDRAAFEAAWAPDGAVCVARTRDGTSPKKLVEECRGRLKEGSMVDLGDGDQCALRRNDMNSGTVLLRNRTYETRTNF